MLVLGEVRRDVRAAVRAIRRAPATAAVVVLSLGAGIGVNTVVFSWMDAAVLRPLPAVRDASSLMLVESQRADGSYAGISWAQYLDYRRRLTTFRDLLAFRMAPLYVGDPGSTEREYALLVSDNYFSGLGLRPAAGRFFVPDEVSTPGGAPVIVISYDYWQTRYGGSASAIGQRMRVNGWPVAVIGVAPKGFEGTVPRLAFNLFVPATLAPLVQQGSRELEDRSSRGYSALGFLRDGASRAVARSDVGAAARTLAHDFPDTDGGLTADVLSFWDAPRGPQKFMATAIVAVQGVLLLMLVSVCANTANLVLARSFSQQREIGVRLALGAGAWRIASLVLVDSLVLAFCGAALGIAFASWGTGALSALPPLRVRGLPVTFETHFSAAAALFGAGLGVVSALLFAAPAVLQFARADPNLVIRSSALRASPLRIRNGIMGIQIALAVFVLIAGGLTLQSFLQTRTASTGFRTSGLLLAAYDLTDRSDPGDPRSFADRVLQAAREVPGVEGAAIAASVPLDIHGLPSRPFTVEGHAREGDGFDQALSNVVTPGYFGVMDIPFVAGGDFAPLGDRRLPAQAIVNDAFVRTYLPRLDPIGRALTSRGRTFRICGVVRTSLSDAFGEPPIPVIYLSYRDMVSGYGEIHVRTRKGGEATVVTGLRTAIRRLDPELPLFDVRTMSEHIESNLLFRRIPARLFTLVAPLVAGLVGLGIYALVAHAASRRRQEILVRLAIGAPPGRLVRDFTADTVRVAIAGAVTGLVGAVVLLASGAEMGREQAAVFAIVPLGVLALSAASAVMPARRAIANPSWGSLRDE
ncbi:MAG TPA: ABC transporter permease [Vicinamibacterales bacterium]|nr:ABC transporter permease [Vicinamibacterales bacterium]